MGLLLRRRMRLKPHVHAWQQLHPVRGCCALGDVISRVTTYVVAGLLLLQDSCDLCFVHGMRYCWSQQLLADRCRLCSCECMCLLLMVRIARLKAPCGAVLYIHVCIGGPVCLHRVVPVHIASHSCIPCGMAALQQRQHGDPRLQQRRVELVETAAC